MRVQLYYLLSNTAPLTALVSTRIYPGLTPSSATLPYVSYKISSRTTEKQQDGYTNYEKLYIDFEICASTVAGAQAVADTIYDALNLLNQEIGDTGSKKFVHQATLLSESDDSELNDGSENPVYEINQTYEINYNK